MAADNYHNLEEKIKRFEEEAISLRKEARDSQDELHNQSKLWAAERNQIYDGYQGIIQKKDEKIKNLTAGNADLKKKCATYEKCAEFVLSEKQKEHARQIDELKQNFKCELEKYLSKVTILEGLFEEKKKEYTMLEVEKSVCETGISALMKLIDGKNEEIMKKDNECERLKSEAEKYIADAASAKNLWTESRKDQLKNISDLAREADASKKRLCDEVAELRSQMIMKEIHYKNEQDKNKGLELKNKGLELKRKELEERIKRDEEINKKIEEYYKSLTVDNESLKKMVVEGSNPDYEDLKKRISELASRMNSIGKNIDTKMEINALYQKMQDLEKRVDADYAKYNAKPITAIEPVVNEGTKDKTGQNPAYEQQEEQEESEEKQQEESEEKQQEEQQEEQKPAHEQPATGKKQKKDVVEISRIKIVPKFMLSKWWALLPPALGAAAGIAATAFLGPGLENIIDDIGMSISESESFWKYPAIAFSYLAGACIGGKLLDKFIPVNKDNWCAQGRIGILGQKSPWYGREYLDMQIIADVYKIDYVNPEKRDIYGDRVDKNGFPIKKGKKGVSISKQHYYHIGKIARKLPQKIDEDKLNEALWNYEKELLSANLDKNDMLEKLKIKRKEIIEQFNYEAHNADFNQYIFLYYDKRPTEKDWNNEVVTIEDIEREIAASLSVYDRGKKNKFMDKSKKGLGCLAYTSFVKEKPFMSIEEMPKAKEDMWKSLFMIPKEFFSNLFRLKPWEAVKSVPKNIIYAVNDFPKYFRSLGAGYYQVEKIDEKRRWFLEKDPIRTLVEGTDYKLRLSHGGPCILEADKRRIMSLLGGLICLGKKRPFYYIRIFDSKKIPDEEKIQNAPNPEDYKNTLRFFCTHAFHVEDDAFAKKHMKRFNYTTNEQGVRVPDIYNPKSIAQQGKLDRFRAGSLLKRG